ncbi:fungal-specific transcription factor domain-containing protein [Aspergillus fruticulosus]
MTGNIRDLSADGASAVLGKPRAKGLQTSGRRKRPRVPDAERKRVRVACESCRRRRLRCNGSRPCERCQGLGKHCFYKPSSSAPATEEGAGIDVGDELGAESAGAHCQWNRALEESTLNRHYERKELTSTKPGSSNEGSILLNCPLAPSASMVTVNQWKTHFEGTYSHWAFFSTVRRAVSADNVPAEEVGEADCGEGTIHQTSNISFGLDWRTCVLNALPPRNVMDFLTTTYFRFAQSGYFCVHPEIFSRKLVAFYDGANEFAGSDGLSSRRSIDFTSLLFMVLAIGSQFAEVGDTSAANSASTGHEDTIPLDLSQVTVPTPSQNPGWRFYEVSRKLLPDLICSSSMTSVQVCLLQGLFLPSTTSRDASYNILGLAMRMAINMGLHRSFYSTSLHAHVRELRNRLWWSVYIADRLYITDMGRPLSIHDSEIDAPFPKHMLDWANEAMDSTNVDTMIALALYCQLLGRIVESVYCKPASVQKSDTSLCPNTFIELKQALEDWREKLPPHFNFEMFSTRSVAHLHLMYEQANLLFTRPCLNSAVLMRESTLASRGRAESFLRQQSQACVDAAVSVIQILSELKSRSLLCGYSSHDALYCSSALYVLLLADRRLNKEVKIPRYTLEKGIQILLVLARDSEAAASSLRYILRVMVHSPPETTGSNSSPVVSHDSSHPRAESIGRDAWKAWRAAQTARGSYHIEPVENSDQDLCKNGHSPLQPHSFGRTSTFGAEPNDFDLLNIYGQCQMHSVVAEDEGHVFPDASLGGPPFWIPNCPGLDGLT